MRGRVVDLHTTRELRLAPDVAVNGLQPKELVDTLGCGKRWRRRRTLIRSMSW